MDANGFGGHTALFGAVVSYPNFWMNFTGGWAHSRKPQNAAFARLLLEHGANPNPRASFREPVITNSERTFRDHYKYQQGDIDRLVNQAAQSGAQALITTAKDAVKLKSLSFALPCFVVDITSQIEDKESFLERITRAVDAPRS